VSFIIETRELLYRPIAALTAELVLEYSLTPHLTQSRSFRRRTSQPITWLILTNKTVQEIHKLNTLIVMSAHYLLSLMTVFIYLKQPC